MELQTSKIVVVAKSTYLFEAKGFDRLETWYVMASIFRFKVYLNSFLSSLHLKSQYHTQPLLSNLLSMSRFPRSIFVPLYDLVEISNNIFTQ